MIPSDSIGTSEDFFFEDPTLLQRKTSSTNLSLFDLEKIEKKAVYCNLPKTNIAPETLCEASWQVLC